MIRPAGHRVLVEADKIDEKSGSLFLPPDIRAKMGDAQIYGTIIAIGPNAWKAFDSGEPWAKVGDRVAFAKYGGFNIEDPEDKKLYRLLNDEDVCAVVEGGKEA